MSFPKNYKVAVLIAIVVGFFMTFVGFAPMASATVEQGGHIVLTPACNGQVGMDIRAFNDIEGSAPISFVLTDNASQTVFEGLGLTDIAYGSVRTSNLLMNVEDIYDITATAPGYTERFQGTFTCEPTQTQKVWVCKVVGGPGHYSLKEGKQPIEVSANALGDDVQPIVGAPFSDAQPSFVVASDDRALCEAGLPPVVGAPVTPIAPTSVDKCGINDDTYTVPSKDGVVYKIGGVVKAAGTYPGVGVVAITAHPVNGTIVLEGTTSWTFTFTNVPCQPDPVIAPRADISSRCEILVGEKSGLTVVDAKLGSDSSDGDSFEVAETIDGVTVFYYIPVATGEEITLQVFYSQEDGKKVSLVINARDVVQDSLSFDTATCAAKVTTPPPPPTKVCPKGTKWIDLNSNGKVENGECKTPVMHKPPVVKPPVKLVTPPNNAVPSADTGWETHQNQGGSMLPWLIGLGLLTGMALVTATIVSRRRGAYRD